EGDVVRIRLHSPDGVQGRLKFEKRSGRGQHQCDAPENRREMPSASLTRPFKKALHRLGALTADQLIYLANDLSSHGLRAERQAGNGDCDEQDGSDREKRVVRKRRAKPRDVVVPRCAKRALEHFEDRWDGHSPMVPHRVPDRVNKRLATQPLRTLATFNPIMASGLRPWSTTFATKPNGMDTFACDQNGCK